MKSLFFLSLSLFALTLFSCQEDSKDARIEVWLTDDAGDFKAVNIDVQGVEVNTSESDDDAGWKAVDVTPGIYNLLALANGNDTLLGGLQLSPGRISQIRLQLGENNTIIDKDSVEHPLQTPSGQQSGLKINVHQSLAEGINYKIVLDFDAAKSVIKTGADNYILKPVVRVVTSAEGGAIKGEVSPAQVVSVSVMASDTVYTTSSTDEAGKFLIGGLAEGTYTLVIDSGSETPDIEKADVSVKPGEVTDVGEISLE